MALPEQIRKQSEEVQRLYAEMNVDGDNPEASNDGQPSPEPTETPEPKAEKPAEQTPAPESVAESNGKEQLPPEVKPSQVDGESFEQKYRTLQGMYNREVPRLRNENRNLSERVTQMEQLLSNMQQPQQPQQAQQAQPEVPSVSKEEIEEYGEDTVDLFRRLSRQETAPYLQKIEQLERVIQDLQSNVSNVVPQIDNVVKSQQQTTEERFWTGLQNAVPNWQEVNNNQDFHTWLLEYDPIAGATRQDLLEQAQASYDSQRVASFFRAWQNLNPSHGQQQEAPQVNTSQSELDKQVQPGKARSGSAPTVSEGRTYTPNDIRDFFKDVSMGKYKGREDERDRIERDIFAAQQQGRIVANA